MGSLATKLDSAQKRLTVFEQIVAELDDEDLNALFHALDDKDEAGRYRVSIRTLAKQLASEGHHIGCTALGEERCRRAEARS